MTKELELWQFIADRLQAGQRVVLLVVAASYGSSPGRPGYKMAIAASGELIGSIGGGVMEVDLVEYCRSILSGQVAMVNGLSLEQVHRRNVPNSSGMICSGKQTVIFKMLSDDDLSVVESAANGVKDRDGSCLIVTAGAIDVASPNGGDQNGPQSDLTFTRRSDADFKYSERLGVKNDLYIVGGGHCALALSELMSKIGFHILLFDDRPHLNTIAKNRYANEIKLIDGYDEIGRHIDSDDRAYVVVMTLGYRSDAVVIRPLLDKDFKYFGVLGSKAKMATLYRELVEEGFSSDRLQRIRTPIGLPINSHSPEEIAVSIAGEIISIKNGADMEPLSQ